MSKKPYIALLSCFAWYGCGGSPPGEYTLPRPPSPPPAAPYIKGKQPPFQSPPPAKSQPATPPPDGPATPPRDGKASPTEATQPPADEKTNGTETQAPENGDLETKPSGTNQSSNSQSKTPIDPPSPLLDPVPKKVQQPRVVMIKERPPEPLVETRPVAPGPSHIWVGGYWSWTGSRFWWMPGYWAPPRVGYYYHPYRWGYYGNRWTLYRGGWSVRGRRRVVYPSPRRPVRAYSRRYHTPRRRVFRRR